MFGLFGKKREPDCSEAVQLNPLCGPQETVLSCKHCGAREHIKHPRGTEVEIRHYCGKGFSDEYVAKQGAELREARLQTIIARHENAKLAKRIGNQRRAIKQMLDYMNERNAQAR